MYRVRWHIELLFKRIKQVLDVHHLRCENWRRARASLLAYLLCWVLQEEECSQIRLLLGDGQKALEPVQHPGQMPQADLGQQQALSDWTLAVLLVDELRCQVRGPISWQRWQQCAPQLQRFLRASPRRRTHWFFQTRSWLTEPEEREVAR